MRLFYGTKSNSDRKYCVRKHIYTRHPYYIGILLITKYFYSERNWIQLQSKYILICFYLFVFVITADMKWRNIICVPCRMNSWRDKKCEIAWPLGFLSYLLNILCHVYFLIQWVYLMHTIRQINCFSYAAAKWFQHNVT